MTHPPQNPPLAAALVLCAAAFVAGTTLLAKMLGTDALGPALHPLQVSQGRFVFAFAVIAAGMAVLRPGFTGIAWGQHALRVGFGWGGVTFMFAASAFIPLSDATAISFLNPVVAMVLAGPVLAETVGRVRKTAAVVALVGALILLRPTAAAFQPAALLAVGAALFLGAEAVVIKLLSRREGPLQILFLNNLIGMVLASAAVLPVWQAPTPAQWMALAGIGGLMAATQACFINAISRADASFVTPFWYSTLVFAALYDLAVFGEAPDTVSVLGALVIVGGAGLLAWREARVRPSVVPPGGTVPRPPR